MAWRRIPIRWCSRSDNTMPLVTRRNSWRGSTSAVLLRLRERPESALLARCRATWRGSLHPPTTAAQPWPREPLKLPRSCRSGLARQDDLICHICWRAGAEPRRLLIKEGDGKMLFSRWLLTWPGARIAPTDACARNDRAGLVTHCFLPQLILRSGCRTGYTAPKSDCPSACASRDGPDCPRVRIRQRIRRSAP